MFKIGDRHTKISVSTWNQEVRVHLWKFHQSCFDRNKFYPTKKGIALTIKEWQDLKALVSQVDEVIGCTNAMLKLEDDEEITVQDAVEARTFIQTFNLTRMHSENKKIRINFRYVLTKTVIHK